MIAGAWPHKSEASRPLKLRGVPSQDSGGGVYGQVPFCLKSESSIGGLCGGLKQGGHAFEESAQG
jgi:hypothetical protein